MLTALALPNRPPFQRPKDKDCTDEFEDTGHSAHAREMLTEMKVGDWVVRYAAPATRCAPTPTPPSTAVRRSGVILSTSAVRSLTRRASLFALPRSFPSPAISMVLQHGKPDKSAKKASEGGGDMMMMLVPALLLIAALYYQFVVKAQPQ